MDETPIGAKTPSTGAFTTLRAFNGIDATVIGARAPRAAHFSAVRLAADTADARPGAPSKCTLAFTGDAEGSNVIEVPAGQTRALDVVDSNGASLLSLSSSGSMSGASSVHPEGAALRIDGDVVVSRGNVQLLDGDFLSGYVPLSVPDYVFTPTYPLLQIEELAPFGTFRRCVHGERAVSPSFSLSPSRSHTRTRTRTLLYPLSLLPLSHFPSQCASTGTCPT